MLAVHLHNLRFHAHHGVYEEEKILGNDYEINMDVKIAQVARVESIHQTVNYITIYHIVKKKMEQPTPLLETLAQEIAEAVHVLDDRIRSVHISIKKLYPPVINFEGAVGVSFSKEFA